MFEPWPAIAGFARVFPGETADDALFAFAAGPADALPVILIHGLGDEADTWRHLFPLLTDRYRLIAVDLPGFGRSPRPRKRRSGDFAAAAGRLARLLDQTGPAVLVGSSLGAALALAAARLRPRTARGVVCLDGGLPAIGGLTPAVAKSLLPFVGETGYRGFRDRPDAAYASLAPYYADLAALPAADRDFLYRRVNDRVASATQMAAYFGLFRSYAWWSLRREAAAFAAVLASGLKLAVAWGGQDRIIPAGAVAASAARLPAGAFQLWHDSGHLPQQDAPELVAQAIADFMNRLD